MILEIKHFDFSVLSNLMVDKFVEKLCSHEQDKK